MKINLENLYVDINIKLRHRAKEIQTSPLNFRSVRETFFIIFCLRLT